MIKTLSKTDSGILNIVRNIVSKCNQALDHERHLYALIQTNIYQEVVLLLEDMQEYAQNPNRLPYFERKRKIKELEKSIESITDSFSLKCEEIWLISEYLEKSVLELTISELDYHEQGIKSNISRMTMSDVNYLLKGGIKYYLKKTSLDLNLKNCPKISEKSNAEKFILS